MVVSRVAKQSRTCDVTICNIHEQLILIVRFLKACYLLKNAHYYKEQLCIAIANCIKFMFGKFHSFSSNTLGM